ncbi:MAG: MBL fold metallo-hydrolase [Saprospiraceae bacterium]|nr:MBL fold metallo-hydrolase [Saprospiraceae bacterium]
MRSKQFGGKLTKTWKLIYQNSPNWKDGVFQNLEKTSSAIDWKQLPEILCRQIKGHHNGYPQLPLPIKDFDASEFLKPSKDPKFIWFGHSVVLIRWHDMSILIDPMFGSDASPIGPKRTKRFSNNTLDIISTLPNIDIVLLTHDHYDHLDYESIQLLKAKTKKYIVALGCKRHLEHWGVEAERVVEMDWWTSLVEGGIRITFTPTRHFSGRGLTSLSKCMWGGWALQSEDANIWFSGDSGYGSHFEEIGKRLGPFDIGFIECGQYCKDWPQVHLFPHEGIQAAKDVGVRIAIPVHWAGFNLSYQHSWFEPAVEFKKSAKQENIIAITPKLGEIFNAQSISENWWEVHIEL